MLRKRRVTIFYITLLQLSLLVNFQKILLLISQPPVPLTFTVMGSRYCNRQIRFNLPAFGRQCTIYNTYIQIHNSTVARYPGRNTQYTHTYIQHRADDLIEWNYSFIQQITFYTMHISTAIATINNLQTNFLFNESFF